MEFDKLTGTVAWFNARKGFGFVTPDDAMGEKDIFLHWSGIAMEGYKQLKAGDQVEYELKDSPKGVIAVNVKLIKASEDPQQQ